MQVKVLKAFRDQYGQHVYDDIIEVDDKVVGAWIEGGWVEPAENKLMAAPSENKASDVAETGNTASEPSGDNKPVRRKIQHRKKAAKK